MNYRLLFLVIFVGASILAVFFEFSRPESKKEDPANKEIVENSQKSGPFDDSDQDGLKNWQENLLGTDSKNDDTDQDGTNDGDEANLNRNPLKPPPDQRGTGYIQGMLGEKLPGDETSPKGSVLDTNESEVIRDETNLNPLKEYGNKVAELIINHDFVNKTKERALFEAITGENPPKPSDFDGLKELSSQYNTLHQNLSNLFMPKEVEIEAKNINISYKNFSLSLLDLSSYKEAGKIEFSAFEKYTESAIALGKAIISLSKLLQKESVDFKQGEPGYLFMQMR